MLLEESRWVLRNPAASLRVRSRLDTYGLGPRGELFRVPTVPGPLRVASMSINMLFPGPGQIPTVTEGTFRRRKHWHHLPAAGG